MAGDVRTFEYRALAGASSPDMIYSTADGLSGYLAAMNGRVDRVVVRQADDGQRSGMTTDRVLRSRTEGAVVYVARKDCADVRIMTGPTVGRACGGDLAHAEAQALLIVPTVWKVAGSAALAAKLS